MPNEPDDRVSDADNPEDQKIDPNLDDDGNIELKPVRQIINETIAACPQAFNKFRITDPGIVAKDQKRREQREKKDAKKAASKAPGNTVKRGPGRPRKNAVTLDDNSAEEPPQKKRKTDHADEYDIVLTDSSESASEISPPKEKGKGKAKLKAEDSDVGFEITAYIYVERAIKVSEDDRYVSYGLIVFTSTSTYTEFLGKISQQLKCSTNFLIEERILWKFQTPKNASLLPLGFSVGFTSMVKQVKGKKPDGRIIRLAMPPPTKPAVENPPWFIEGDEGLRGYRNGFDYMQLEGSGTEGTHDSIVEQRASFDKAIEPHKEALLEKYPENNHPQFPNKRIYTDIFTKSHYELTDAKISVWASHLARGNATLDKPPVSTRFDLKSRIKAPVTAAPQPTPPAAPEPASQASNILGAGGSSLLDILLLGMIQNQQQQQKQLQLAMPAVYAPQALAGFPPVVAPPPPAAVAPLPSVSSAPQSPAKARLPLVTIEAFCERYNITATDQQRLEKLEFQSGDKIDILSEDDWKTFAGFTSLSWRRIVEKNTTFIRDARNGLWA